MLSVLIAIIVPQKLEAELGHTKESHLLYSYLSHMQTMSLNAGIFFWFLRKRDKRPHKYGPSRYGIEDSMQNAPPLKGVHEHNGLLPSSVDA